MNRDGLTAATHTVPLCGAGGEPVSLHATLASHGLAWLPPNDIASDELTLTTTLSLSDGSARTVSMRENAPGTLAIFVDGRRPSAAHLREIVRAVRAMFALDDDLAPFYATLANDAELAFATAGYGRLLRSPTAFEDIVRTICTTNCAWSATERMIAALVAHLGTAAPLGAPGDGRRRAFPTAAQLATADDAFFRDTMRAGYRGTYLRAFAAAVASGDLYVEAWRLAPRAELSDAELEQLLLALPGVGPYAAAHVMMLFGRCSRLVLDSWTRPRYAQLLGKKSISDKAISRRFKRYGVYAGLAFWLYLWKSRHLGIEAR
jgi:N-glycosylase/DNA lyase